MTGLLTAEMPSETASMNNCSEISAAHLLADTVCPSGGCSLCGRLSHDAMGSVGLPWTMTLYHRLFPLSFPSVQPVSALGCGGEHIDPRPDFGRGTALEMLMGPEVIVDGSNMLQSSVTRRGIVNGVLQQHPLHRADEPFQASVLPGASWIAVLQANPQEAQDQTKSVRREDGFVVGTQELGTAILTACGGEVAPDRQRRFIRQSLHAQARATGMIEDGQHDMPVAVRIGLCQQVHAPDQIAGNGPGDSMFHLPSGTEDRILLPAERIGHVGFADRHAAALGEATIKTVRDRAAARLRHQRFQSDDLIPYPLRFGTGTDATGRCGSTALSPTQMVGARPQPGLDQMPQSDQPQDQKSEPRAHDRLVVVVV